MKRAVPEGQHGAVWRRAAFLALLCIALAALARSADVHRALLELLEASREVIVARPVSGALLFVLLAAVSAMFAFVSIAVVIPLAVYVWGSPLSLLLLWVGWILGGAAAYGTARYLGRPVVRWLTDRTLGRIERYVGPTTPFRFVLLFQLGLPSEIPGYVLGLVKYPFRKFILALALAELPYTIATVYLGAGFIGARSGVVLAVGFALVGLSVGAFYLLRRHMRSADDGG
jgi:uncharacterized membrane protein YdjX (TVP38/TMEM64 family)